MSSRFGSLLVVLLLAGDTRAQQNDAKKIRELIPRPSVNFMFGVAVNPMGSLMFAGEVKDVPGEIAALEKALADGDDVERYCRLSRLYTDTTKAKKTADKAVALATQQYQKDPNNGRISMLVAKALNAAAREDEAEPFLRQAVRQAPQDAECWLSLGDFILHQANGALVGKKSARSVDLMDMVNGRFTKENLPKYRKLMQESAGCYDRAVASAPRDAKMYLARAGFAIQVKMFGLYPRTGVQQVNADTVMQLVGELLGDLEKAAELNPNDPRAQAAAGFFELMSVADQLALDPEKADSPQPKLPMKTIKKVAEISGRLDKLLDHPDKKIAADACYARALMEIHSFFYKQPSATDAGKWLRQAVAMQPRHSSAWELLTMAATSESPKDAIAVCEDRLRIKDDARNRLIAAAARMEENELPQAEQHLRAGLRLAPKDIQINLGLAAVLLKRGDAAGVTEADKVLVDAEALLADKRNSEWTQDAVILRGCHAALAGDLAAARRNLHSVPKSSSRFEAAEKLLKVLGD